MALVMLMVMKDYDDEKMAVTNAMMMVARAAGRKLT